MVSTQSMVFTREKIQDFKDIADELFFYVPDDDAYCLKLEDDNHILEDGDIIVFVDNDIYISCFLIRKEDIAELLI